MGKAGFPWKVIRSGVQPQEDIADTEIRRKVTAAELVESHAGGTVDGGWD